MSSDVIYSSKPYRSNWLSQFGLYRYESATNAKQRYDTERRMCVHFVTIIAAVSLLSFIVFIFVNAKSDIERDDDATDQTVFLSEINAVARNGTNLLKHQLTTVFYPNEQIGPSRYFDRPKYVSTTPMNLMSHESSTAAYQKDVDAPSKHRRNFAELLPEDERSARALDIPIDFEMHNNNNYSSSHVIFPDDTISNSDSRVNSIRDILDHVDDDANESVFPSQVSRGRGIRIAGTYRRYKQYDLKDTLATMQSMIHEQQVSATNSEYGNRKRPKDPFSKFKPKSVSDVNLLAMNQFRFAPYTHNKPRPLLRSPASDAKQKPPDYYVNQNVAESMYNQILWASNNRMKTSDDSMNSRHEHVPKKQKPFSLMLDVYPMPASDDDMATVSSTRYPPHAMRQPRPIYPMPVDANAINHNLQYANDNSYYNQMKFPQLQSYHRIPSDASPTAASYVNVNAPHPNYYYYRNYMPKAQNVYTSNQFRRPSSVYDVPSPSDDTPSQITVHLNLFPNKKRAKSSPTSRMRNVQVLNSGHLSHANDDDDDDDNDNRLYTRRLEYENLADIAHVSMPLVSSSSRSHNNYDKLSSQPIKSPTLPTPTPNWMLPRFDEVVNSTKIAQNMSPSFHSSESFGFDATTNYENIQSTNTAKPILGSNQSMATASGRRIFLPNSPQSGRFSKSSSAQSVLSIDDVNRATILSTLASNAAHATQQQYQQQSSPILIPTAAITDATSANDGIMRRIKFPQN